MRSFHSFEALDNSSTHSTFYNYNVFMWPYEPNPARLNEVAISLSNRRDFKIIRSFVSEGGGFIGSCYGALAASSGFLNPLSGLHLLQAYNPSIPFLPFLKLHDRAVVP